MQEHIDENEAIIEKYHRKIDEIIRLVKDHSESDEEFRWPPTAADYRRMKEQEKRSCMTKKQQQEQLIDNGTGKHSTMSTDDQGVFL
jgi:hypothetical protein